MMNMFGLSSKNKKTKKNTKKAPSSKKTVNKMMRADYIQTQDTNPPLNLNNFQPQMMTEDEALRQALLASKKFGNPMRNPHQDWAIEEEELLPEFFEKNETQNALGQDGLQLDDCMNVNVSLGTEQVKAKTTTQTSPVLVKIEEMMFNDQDVDVEAVIDLVCVIDISGSMQGQRIKYVKQTLLELMNFIEGNNRMALVLFDNKCEIKMNFKRIVPENIERIQEIIESIKTRGSTNITGAVKMAQELLGQRKTSNSVGTIFLLSDGKHNCGKLSNSLLFDDDMTRTKAEYTLSTFGYGDDHDAVVLQSMSEEKGGSYYFVEDIITVDECFVDCLGSISSSLGKNLRGTLALIKTDVFPDIKFSETYGSYWKDLTAQIKTFKIHSFYSGFSKNLLALVDLGASPGLVDGVEKEVKIGELSIQIDSLNQEPKTSVIVRSLVIKVLPEDSIITIVENEEVDKQMTRVKGVKVIEQAEILKSAGEYNEALQLMDGFKDDLEKKSYANHTLFGGMKEMIGRQRGMYENEMKGVKNRVKTKNFVTQTKNLFDNEQSAGHYGGISANLYQNKRTSKMMTKLKKSKNSC